MAQDKKYLPIFGKVFTFSNGGESFQFSGKADELINFIQENKNSNGYINFDATKQKNDNTKLSVVLNTFESKTQQSDNQDDDGSNLPF